jgi:hypothetical protein
MRKVMEKDLILNRNIILINGLIFAGSLTLFTIMDPELPPRVYAGFSAFMVAFLPAVMVTREDKFQAMVLGCSLPVRRKTIVRARFLLSLAMGLGGVLLAFLLAVVLPFARFRPEDLFAWGPLLTAVSGILIVLALVLPFTLRYGMKGLLIFLIAAQVLGVVLLTFVQVTGSSADRVLLERIIGGFGRLHTALGQGGFTILLLAFLLAALGVSYLVSVRVFERREL